MTRQLAVFGINDDLDNLGARIYKDAVDSQHWSSHAAFTEHDADVTVPSRVYDALDDFRDDMPLDIIYSVGRNRLGKIGQLTQEMLWDVYESNVLGFIHVLNQAWPRWQEHKCSVTAVVSDSSRIAMRGSIAYASSKAALVHAIKCAARELAPNWRVNGVSPGVIADTPMTLMVDSVVPELRGWTLEEAMTYERSLIPMGRRVTKAEVSQLVIQTTMGPEFMTGSIIDITGGK